MRLKQKVLTTNSSVDLAIRDAVNALIENSLPKILLIGPKSELFERIQASFTWSDHEPTVLYDNAHHDLIIVNDANVYMQVLELIPRQSALMFIDQNNTLSSKQLAACQQVLFAYLPGISPRYAHGHVRCLLQLQKSLVGLSNDCPLIISSNHQIKLLKKLFRLLDSSSYAYIHTDNIEKFIACFEQLSLNTSYQLQKIFYDVDEYLSWKPDKEIETVIVITDKANRIKSIREHTPMDVKLLIVGPETKQTDIVLPLEESRNDYILQILYYCHEFNRSRKRPRFIQIGNIDKVLTSTFTSNTAFRTEILDTLKNRTMRFRNTPVLINDISVGYVSFMELLHRFEHELMTELQSFSGNHLELAQIISDMARTTLQQKYESLGLKKK